MQLSLISNNVSRIRILLTLISTRRLKRSKFWRKMFALKIANCNLKSGVLLSFFFFLHQTAQSISNSAPKVSKVLDILKLIDFGYCNSYIFGFICKLNRKIDLIRIHILLDSVILSCISFLPWNLSTNKR